MPFKLSLPLNTILAFLILSSPMWAQEDTVQLEFQAEHTKILSSMDFSPDKRYAATGSHDRTVKVWDLQSKKLLRTFRGHQRQVSVVRFCNNDKHLLTGESGPLFGRIYSIRKWNYRTGHEIYAINGIPGMINDIQVSPDNKHFIVEIGRAATSYFEVRDMESGEINIELSKLLRVDSGIKSFFSRKTLSRVFRNPKKNNKKTKVKWGIDNHTLALFNHKTVTIWLFEENKKPRKLIVNPKYKISTIEMGKDQSIYIGGFNGELERYFYDSRKRRVKKKKTISKLDDFIMAIKYDIKNEIILARSVDGFTSIWSTTDELLNSYQDNNVYTVYETFNTDEEILLSANANGTVTIWDRITNKPPKIIGNEERPITKIFPTRIGKDSLVLTYSRHEKKHQINFWKISDGELKDLKKDGKRKKKLKNNEINNNYTIKTKLKTKNFSKVRGFKFLNKMRLNVGVYHLLNNPIPIAIHPTGESIATIGKDGISIKSIYSGETGNTVNISSKLYINISFLPNGKELVLFDSQGDMEVWRVADGAKMRSTPTVKATNWVTDIRSSLGNGRIVTADKDGYVKVWNLYNGKLDTYFQAHKNGFSAMDCSRKYNLIATGGVNGRVKVWDAQIGEEADSALIIRHQNSITDLKFFPDSKFLISAGKDNFVQTWDIENAKKPLWQLRASTPVDHINVDKNSKLIAISSELGDFQIWPFQRFYLFPLFGNELGKKGKKGNINTQYFGSKIMNKWPILKSVFGKELNKGVSAMEVYPAKTDNPIANFFMGKHAFYAEQNAPFVKGKIIYSSKSASMYKIKHRRFKKFKGFHTDEITSLDLNPNKNRMVSGSKDTNIKIWDINSRRVIATYNEHRAPVTNVQFSEDGKHIYSADEDNRIIIWDAIEHKCIATIVSKKEQDYIIYTPDNYYLSSKGSAGDIHFIYNDTTVYLFEQFDLKYNRPDIVLQRIGLISDTLAQAYSRAYKKRLDKMGFSEEELGLEYHAPVVRLLNKLDMPEATTDSDLVLSLKAYDTKFSLDRLKIAVNDVPIYGTKGRHIETANPQLWELSIPIELTAGRNKVTISVLNNKGTESLKETFYTRCDAPAIEPNLYLVGIGVGQFTNSLTNLKYVAKDLRDFIQFIDTSSNSYQNIIIDTLINSDVNITNLLKIKKRLKNTKINDHVILFVAGHGILDNSLDFYLATNTNHASEHSTIGIAYEDLENLLDSIPARQKLLLMDACHSGEIEKDNTVKSYSSAEKSESLELRSDRNRYNYKSIGLENSFELMKLLFIDLRRSTGATVISSAGGIEKALEGDVWGNSAFTYSLIQGLKELKEEKTNTDGIPISEIRNFIFTEVPNITSNKQNPTMRIDNIANDWKLRIKKNRAIPN